MAGVDWLDTLADPSAGITLGPIGERDLPFLEALYASTRREEMAPLDWSEQRKNAFLARQFRAQHAHYRRQFAGAHFLLIEHRGESAGRIY